MKRQELMQKLAALNGMLDNVKRHAKKSTFGMNDQITYAEYMSIESIQGQVKNALNMMQVIEHLRPF